MAFDPTEVASNQEAQQRIVAAGAPTEFAKGPGQDGVQVAGVGKLFDLLNMLDSGVTPPKPPKVKAATAGQARVLTPEQLAAVPEVVDPRVAPRMPTPQEAGLTSDVFSESATKRALAGQVLSPEGVAKFEAQNLKALGVGEESPIDVLQDAQSALAADASEAALPSLDIADQAKRALNAEVQGFKPETAIVSDEVATKILDRVSAKEQNIKSLKDGGDFNYDYIDTIDDVKAMITAVGETYKGETNVVTRGSRTNKETRSAATRILLDEIGFTRKLLNRSIGDGALTAEEFVASRDLLVSSAIKLEEMATKINDGGATDIERLRFRRQMAIHSGIQLQLKGAQTEAARALQSFQIVIDGEMDAIRFGQEAKRLLAESGADGVTDAMASSLLAAGKKNGLKGVNGFVVTSRYAKTKQMVHEAYLVGLLSSPATQAKNIVGTISFMAYQLPSELISGMYGSIVRAGKKPFGQTHVPISEEQVYTSDVLLRVKGWKDSFGDAMAAGSLAWRTEVPTGASKLDVEQYAVISGESNSFLERSISEVSKRMRIPFRLLLSADEFTKTISQRGEFYTAVNRRYQHSLRKGMSEQEALDEAGMMMLDPKAVSEELDLKGKYDTLQSDLGFVGKITTPIQQSFLGRFVVPFATAPTNSILRTMEYTPFSKTSSELLGFKLGAGGVNKVSSKVHQLAVGRLALGSGTMALAGSYAQEGRIIGAMPSDERARNEFVKAGKKPYSFVTKGPDFPEDMPMYDSFGIPNGALNYTSFSGYEPVAGILAISADYVQRQNLTNDPMMREHFLVSGALAIADYYKEAPMLQGIADVAAFMKNEGSASDIARSYVESASIIGVPNPLSSLQRMFQRLADPTKIKPRGDFDYWTIEDVRETAVDDNGETYFINSPEFSKTEPYYRLVGTPKNDSTSMVMEFLEEMDALRSKDSFFRDERDLNAVVYDTVGHIKGKEDFSFANNPVKALAGNFIGIRMASAEELEPYEVELIRLSHSNDRWPLTNPESMNGIKLSYGMQSDLVGQAKNETKVFRQGYGELTFRDALIALVESYEYESLPDDSKASQLKKLNDAFLQQGFIELLEDPEYANMRQAYEETQALKMDGRQ